MVEVDLRTMDMCYAMCDMRCAIRGMRCASRQPTPELSNPLRGSARYRRPRPTLKNRTSAVRPSTITPAATAVRTILLVPNVDEVVLPEEAAVPDARSAVVSVTSRGKGGDMAKGSQEGVSPLGAHGDMLVVSLCGPIGGEGVNGEISRRRQRLPATSNTGDVVAGVNSECILVSNYAAEPCRMHLDSLSDDSVATH